MPTTLTLLAALALVLILRAAWIRDRAETAERERRAAEMAALDARVERARLKYIAMQRSVEAAKARNRTPRPR